MGKMWKELACMSYAIRSATSWTPETSDSTRYPFKWFLQRCYASVTGFQALVPRSLGIKENSSCVLTLNTTTFWQVCKGKLKLTPISCPITVRPTICPHVTTREPINEFSWNLVLRESCEPENVRELWKCRQCWLLGNKTSKIKNYFTVTLLFAKLCIFF